MLYAGTAAVAAVPLLGLVTRRAPAALVLGAQAAAVACHFGGLLAYAVAHGQLPLSGLAPALSSLAFLVGLLALLIQGLTREDAIVVVASPLVVVPLVIGLLAGFAPSPPGLAPRGGWFLLHVAASLLGIALLGVAFVAAALYLAQHRELKARRFGVIFQFFPPLEQLDRLNHVALVGGFPALTAGIALAAAHALGAGAGPQSAAHLAWGLLAWLVLGGIAGGRLAGWLRGRRAAYASVAGFIAVAVTFLILQATAGGGRFL